MSQRDIPHHVASWLTIKLGDLPRGTTICSGSGWGIGQWAVSNCVVHHLHCIFCHHRYHHHFPFVFCPLKQSFISAYKLLPFFFPQNSLPIPLWLVQKWENSCVVVSCLLVKYNIKIFSFASCSTEKYLNIHLNGNRQFHWTHKKLSVFAQC